MIETIDRGLKEERFNVSVSKLCEWFDVPRRIFHCRPAGNYYTKKFTDFNNFLVEENVDSEIMSISQEVEESACLSD